MHGLTVVTGAAGAIGRRLVPRLAAEGRAVVAVDRVPVAAPAGGRALALDLLAPDLPRLDGAGAVVHLAAIMSNERDLPGAALDLVRGNLFTLLGALRLAPGAARLVLASSMVVYGIPDRRPVPESHPLRPANLYAAGKVAAEGAAAVFAGRPGRTACALRIGSVYGPGDPPGRALPSFVHAVRRGERPVVRGEAMRDYVHVDDVVEAIVRALDATAGGAFNVGTGRSTGTRELARLVLAAAGDPRDPEIAGTARGADVVLDPGRAATRLGFTARIRLEDGLAALVRGEEGP